MLDTTVNTLHDCANFIKLMSETRLIKNSQVRESLSKFHLKHSTLFNGSEVDSHLYLHLDSDSDARFHWQFIT